MFFKEASSQPHWVEVMHKEIKGLKDNNTWSLVPLSHDKKPIRCKWIYKAKSLSYGTIDKHKARLVAKGFSQIKGTNYEETFSSVSKMTVLWILIVTEASKS